MRIDRFYILFATCILMALTVSQSVFAMIPERQTHLDLKIVQVEPLKPMIDSEKVSWVVPTDMQPTNDGQRIGSQILDRSVASLLQGKYFQDSELLKSAKKIENAMKANVSFGDSKPGAVHHNIEMQFDAFQSRARLTYTGYLTANIIYSGQNQNLQVNLVRPLSDTTSVSLESQSVTQTNLVKMNWAF